MHEVPRSGAAAWLAGKLGQGYELDAKLWAGLWMIDNNPPAEGITRQSAGHDDRGNHYTWRSLENGTKFVIMKNYPTEQELRETLGKQFLIDDLTYGTYYWSVSLTAL